MTLLHSGHRSKLNLSTEEILAISQEISRNFTPRFSSRISAGKIRLSPRELLDIGQEISRDFAPKLSYDAPELMLLPVDPRHLHACWHLGETQEIPAPDDDGEARLTLRIYSQPDEKQESAETASWFDIAIDNAKAGQSVSLSEAAAGETVYSAAIGLCHPDDGFTILARSNKVHAPVGRAAWRQDHENSATSPSRTASGQGTGR